MFTTCEQVSAPIKQQKVNFCLSAGADCRVALHLRTSLFRKFSSPCDWMTNYSLDDYVEILSTGGEHMFQKSHTTDKKKVIDEANGMISMHDFHGELPFHEELPLVRAKLRKRARNTVTSIKNAKSVGIVMRRSLTTADIIQFAEAMRQLFPSSHFHILNIRDEPGSRFYSKRELTGKHWSIQEISFDDTHPLGRTRDNPLFWHGDEKTWLQVLQKRYYLIASPERGFAGRIWQGIKMAYSPLLQMLKFPGK